MKFSLILLLIAVTYIQYGECISRSEVIKRAKYWYGKKIPYSMSRWTNDPNGKKYRTDCSGFVSMAWKLPSSMTTVTLPQVSNRISRGQLMSGDILLKRKPGAIGHVVIFDKWAGPNHYWGYEQTPPRTTYRKIPYPYFGPGYEPYRYRNIAGQPVVPKPGPSGKCICNKPGKRYCGSELSGSCAANHIYQCSGKKNSPAHAFGPCKKGCVVGSGGKNSYCKK